jgi:hypothetical protein
MSRKLTKALREQKRKTQQVPQEIYGTLISIGGTVETKDRPSFVNVQLRDNQNEIIQAFNNKVAASPNLPVIVHREGNRYVIQGVNTQRYQSNWNNYAPYLPKHGTSHSFADGGGGDVSWIFSRQFMPNLVYPNGGGTTGSSAYIAPHVLLDANRVWRYVGATGTDNLLNYKGTGSSSAMLLIYIDATNGNPGILVGSGSYFPNSLTGTAVIYPYIPIPDPATQIPLAAVRMDTGTSSITWDNLYDVRQFVHAMPSGTSSGGGGGGGIDTIGFVGQNKGIYLATGTVLNVNGSRLTLTSSGTVFNLTNSPDPQELIGIYGMSGTTGLGTGTSISFGNGIIASITGTMLYANLHFGTGTNQVASGDRGVTNGDSHNHFGGDGGEISQAIASAIVLADSKNPPVGADSIGGIDTENGNAFVRFTLTNIRTFFKTTYDTLYQTLNANLTAIAGLTSAANKLIRFTGAGTADVIDYLSGDYTPTLTNAGNISASSLNQDFMYVRLGSFVFVGGSINATHDASGLGLVRMTLPIASNLGTSFDLNGNATTTAASAEFAGSIVADTTNNEAQIAIADTAGAVSRTWRIFFMYKII